MLELSDTYMFNASDEQIWPLIFDPQSLLKLIPGCEEIEQTGPNEYQSTIRVSIGPIKGAYQADIQILEVDPPHFCRMHAAVNGANGAISGQADFKLEAAGEQTHLSYHGKAIITGALGKMNPRFVEGIAKTLIKQGLDRLQKQVNQNEPIHPNKR